MSLVLAYLKDTGLFLIMFALLYYGVSASLSPQGVASKQSLCLLDTANTSTKVFEDAGWIIIARFSWQIKFMVAFF